MKNHYIPLQRTSSLTILGVSFTETLNITPHIDNIITKCYQTFHALKIIRAHGLYGPKLYDITESLIISRIKYAAPSWCGFANHEHIKQLQSLLNKVIRLNYLPANYLKIEAIFASLDERLFSRVKRVTNNPHHVHHQIFPPVKSTSRDMRRRTHNYTKQFSPTKATHSFLVFSILNKLIILIVHHFQFEPFFLLFFAVCCKFNADF